jgi:hypothetical protein
MPRPISWQNNLAELHRRVQDSPRSLYGREDLEQLFGVQERAARALLELMPRVRQANSVVVEREHLLAFLNHCIDAEDLRAHLEELRRHPPKPSRRKLRLSLPRQLEDGNLQSIDRWNIELRRGRLTVHFTTLADVVSKLLQLARVVDSPEFERRFCDDAVLPALSAAQSPVRDEGAMIRAHNRYFLKVAAAHEAHRRRALASGDEAQVLQRIHDQFLAEAAAALVDYGRLAETLGVVPEDLEAYAKKIPAQRSEPSDICQTVPRIGA